MCSIVGAAGPIHNLSNKLKAEFHEFLSCLFSMAEVRGRDASGFWVWRGDHYVYEKRPIPAENLIQRSPRWKSLRYHPGTLYLLHTRAATEGDPNENVNNHPHIGQHSVMVHNGCIFNYEAIMKAEGLELRSDCDSEVLLRLTETQDCIEEGLCHMFRTVHDHTLTASMAIAVVDRRQPNKILCTRNSSNPLYLYRCEKFNCTFFVSTEQIFEYALKLLYKVDDPKVIGAKVQTVEPHWLYELLEDGTITSRHLITLPIKTYSSINNDNEEEIEIQPYITCLVNNIPYKIDVSGNMTSMAQIDEDDEVDYDELGSIEEVLEMPREIANELRAYLQTKVNQTV